MKIISADERLAEKSGAKILIVGVPKIGKTTLLRTLKSTATLFIDLEAGDLAVKDVPVDTLRPQTWEECRDIACYLTGPNPSLPPAASYSEAHFAAIRSHFENQVDIKKYDNIFVDSITVAGRLCFRWSEQQPAAFSDKTGKPDVRGAYGLHAREMIAWLTQLQHARGKNVFFVSILEVTTDDYNTKTWSIQIEGAKTGRELPGIVDEILTLASVDFGDGKPPIRCFICSQPNAFGYPAGDRSGKLDAYEKPHLGDLLHKLNNTAQRKALSFELNQPTAQDQPQQENTDAA
jgi:hypothetical protein